MFNGQHTIEIVAMVSESRDTPVWCMVYDDMDYNIEADVFANQQKYVKALVPYEIYKANLEAGNDKQLMIKSLVESYGLTIGPAKSQGVICAVSSLEYILDTWGFHVLDRSLRLCIGTWEGEANSLTANMLKGIARLIIAFAEKIGVTTNYISTVERGASFPRCEKLILLLNGLETSADAIFCDVLDHSSEYRASYLSAQLEKLADDDKKRILEMVELMVKQVNENK